MPGGIPPTTRRTTLGSLLALAAVSACDVDDLRPPEDDAEPSPAASESSPPDADSRLVEATVGEILQILTVLASARRFASLQASVRELARMHRAHLAVLSPGLDPGKPVRSSVRVPRSPKDALRQVRTAENALQRRLATSAVEARSGSLARLLASMSAAVAQHVASLPTKVGGGGS